jgi:hypothetical protein
VYATGLCLPALSALLSLVVKLEHGNCLVGSTLLALNPKVVTFAQRNHHQLHLLILLQCKQLGRWLRQPAPAQFLQKPSPAKKLPMYLEGSCFDKRALIVASEEMAAITRLLPLFS